MNSIQPIDTNDYILGNPTDKNIRSRLKKFVDWLHSRRIAWNNADLAVYRDYLLNDCNLSPQSVQSHLGTVRSRYREIMRSNEFRRTLHQWASTMNTSPASQKAIVDEILVQIANNADPKNAPVKVIIEQDSADSEHTWLTADQAFDLLSQPLKVHGESLIAERDTAIIALSLCTGLREAEICALEVDDLRLRYGGSTALRVKRGKGSKKRMVPYGGNEWCLDFVEVWLAKTGITEGYVFRGFYNTLESIRDTKMDTSTIIRIMQDYLIMIDGELRPVRHHDLRRTYARACYEAGMDIDMIGLNMGQANRKTTMLYIGRGQLQKRTPPNAYGRAE